MRLSFLLGEIASGLRRNVSMAVSVVLVTMISMYLLGLGLLAQRQVDTMKDYWYDRVQVSIFLCVEGSQYASCAGKATTQAQRDQIKTQLEQMKPPVKDVYYESQADAFKRFKEQFKNSPLGEQATERAFADSFRVSLTDASKYDVIVSSYQGAPGVGRVQDQKQLLDKFFAFMNVVSWAAIILSALMVVCAVLLMATTIRQTAFARRRETGIMRLVGASNVTIQLPFVMETVVAALARRGPGHRDAVGDGALRGERLPEHRAAGHRLHRAARRSRRRAMGGRWGGRAGRADLRVHLATVPARMSGSDSPGSCAPSGLRVWYQRC